MTKLRFVVGLLSLTTITLLGGLVLAATVLPLVTSMDRVVLTSGSMSPSMRPGDVVLVLPEVEHPAGPGSVLLFADAHRAGELIMHRVVEELPRGRYRTQGDANPTPDSTLVTHDMVHGQGRLLVPMVGRPAMWLQNGEPVKAIVSLVLALLAIGLSRYGLLTRYDPWLSKTPSSLKPRPRRTGGHALAWYTATGLFLVALGTAAAQFSAAAHSVTTQNAGNFLQRATVSSYFLKTNSTGNTTSSAVLPLSTSAPTLTTLYNYDTNRDQVAGLALLKSAVGLNETDSLRIQKWQMTSTGPLTLSGTARLRLWSAMKHFSPTKKGSVSVGLYDCDGAGQNCTSFATSIISTTTSWSGGSTGWVAKDWNLGTISRTISTGRTLQVRLVVNGTSEDDMVFAYDTTTYPTELTVG